jgi:hypothetical protein
MNVTGIITGANNTGQKNTKRGKAIRETRKIKETKRIITEEIVIKDMVIRSNAYSYDIQKGEAYVVDRCSSTDNFMAVGADHRLYNGIFYSYPISHSYYCRPGQGHSRKETVVFG